VVADRHVGVERRVLGDETDSSELLGIYGGTVSEHLDPAGTRLEESDREVQKRRLARAIGSDQSDHLAGGNRQRALRERRTPAVTLGEPRGLDGGGHATPF
jgi:hypothetical protein